MKKISWSSSSAWKSSWNQELWKISVCDSQPEVEEVNFDFFFQGHRDKLTKWTEVHHYKVEGSFDLTSQFPVLPNEIPQVFMTSSPGEAAADMARGIWWGYVSTTASLRRIGTIYRLYVPRDSKGYALLASRRLIYRGGTDGHIHLCCWKTVGDNLWWAYTDIWFDHIRQDFCLKNIRPGPRIGGLPEWWTIRSSFNSLIEEAVRIFDDSFPKFKLGPDTLLRDSVAGPSILWTEEELKDRIVAMRGIMRRNIRGRQTSEVPNLQAQAFDNVKKFDGNFLIFAQKFTSLGQSTKESFSEIFGEGITFKTLSSTWLRSRFGDRLTFSTYVKLAKSIDKELRSIGRKIRYLPGRTRKSFYYYDEGFYYGFSSVNLAIVPRDWNALMTFVRTAYEWDFFPTLENVWDAIPLSFVVNWFIDVSSIFEDVDRLIQSRYYDVKTSMLSYKLMTYDERYPLKFSYYIRELDVPLRLGVSSVELGLPSTINLIDGISLLASNA